MSEVPLYHCHGEGHASRSQADSGMTSRGCALGSGTPRVCEREREQERERERERERVREREEREKEKGG